MSSKVIAFLSSLLLSLHSFDFSGLFSSLASSVFIWCRSSSVFIWCRFIWFLSGADRRLFLSGADLSGVGFYLVPMPDPVPGDQLQPCKDVYSRSLVRLQKCICVGISSCISTCISPCISMCISACISTCISGCICICISFFLLFGASSLARTSTAGPWSGRRQTSPNQSECQTGLAFNLHLPPPGRFKQIPTNLVFCFFVANIVKANSSVCC